MKISLGVGLSLLALLPVLAAMQYVWIGDLSRAERAALQARLDLQSAAMARLCDRELARIYLTFQSGPVRGHMESQDIERHLKMARQRWIREAPHPRLIRDLYLSEGSDRSLLFDRVVVPLTPLETETSQHAVVVLDATYISEQFLPGVVRQAFPESRTVEGIYEFVIYDKSDPNQVLFRFPSDADVASTISAPDAQARLFRITPEAFDEVRGEVHEMAPSGNVGSVGVVRTARNGAALKNEAEGVLLLAVRHRSGSLDTAVAAARNRNLILALSIEGVLAFSVAMLILGVKRAHEAAARRMAFVAGLSHDMRTPVAAIQTLAENQARGLLKEDSQIARYGSAILGQTRRLAECIEAALQFAGLQAGRIVSRSVPVDVQELLKRAVERTRAAHFDSTCEIRIQCDSTMRPIAGDPDALCRALQNLLSNALKYGSASAPILVIARTLTESEKSQVEIAVQDHGRGIPSREVGKIFEPFYRTRDAVNSHVGGTGLGLTLVKAIVEAHGGSIRCASVLGQGSIFTLRFPVRPVQ